MFQIISQKKLTLVSDVLWVVKNKGKTVIRFEMAFLVEQDTFPESFPVYPPDDICIFPQGTEIYRSGGGPWGRISSGDRGTDVVTINLTGKIRFQPKTHPFFFSA